MISNAGPNPSNTVPQPLPVRIGTALISTLWSIRKRSSPSSTNAGSVVLNVVACCDGCEAAGQYIPFPRTEADRALTGDPRPSVEARYPTFAGYHAKVRKALNDMVEDRLLLCEDAAAEETRLVQHGLTRGVPAPEGGVLPAVETLKACMPRKHGHKHHH